MRTLFILLGALTCFSALAQNKFVQGKKEGFWIERKGDHTCWLVSSGMYVSGKREGAWQCFVKDIGAEVYREAGNYQNNQREGEWPRWCASSTVAKLTGDSLQGSSFYHHDSLQRQTFYTPVRKNSGWVRIPTSRTYFSAHMDTMSSWEYYHDFFSDRGKVQRRYAYVMDRDYMEWQCGNTGSGKYTYYSSYDRKSALESESLSDASRNHFTTFSRVNADTIIRSSYDGPTELIDSSNWGELYQHYSCFENGKHRCLEDIDSAHPVRCINEICNSGGQVLVKTDLRKIRWDSTTVFDTTYQKGQVQLHGITTWYLDHTMTWHWQYKREQFARTSAGEVLVLRRTRENGCEIETRFSEKGKLRSISNTDCEGDMIELVLPKK
jgi:hypothetical protein